VTPLPIDAEIPQLLRELTTRKCLIVVAEPGAGKTTRLPRALLDLALPGEIIVLEPRRIAARMAARRVAEEAGERVGERVGYTVRFEDVSSPKTRLRFVTEGILTRRFATDPDLKGVSAVVLDEFHERHLHGDLAAAWLRDLRERRPDLLVCVMSATLDAELVARWFDAPIATVGGRTYPVTVTYLGADERPLEAQVVGGVRAALAATSGDILVFLPGAGEIRRSEEALASLASKEGLRVFPLHGDLPPDAQDLAIRKGAGRKVVLATNVAESSLTIDGITAVVDSGLERIAGFDGWSGLSTLDLAKASRASCIQRAGRAGRTQAGTAFRLYAEADFDRRPMHGAPEFARADLTDVELLLASLGKRDLPLLEPPKAEVRAQARALLARLGATDGDGEATPLGRKVLALPLPVRLGCLVHHGIAAGIGGTAILAAAILNERDLRRETRVSFGNQGRSVGDRGADSSDVETLMDLFREVAFANFSGGAIRAADLDAGAVARVRKGIDALTRHGSLRGAATEDAGDAATGERLRRCLLAAFPDRVAKRKKAGSRDLALAGVGVATLAETSVVRHAEWMICASASVRRGRLEVESASEIDPLWLVELFPEKLVEEKVVTFNEATGRAGGLARTLYDGVVLDEAKFTPPPELLERTLARALLAKGAHRLTKKEGALDRLIHRVAFARRVAPELPPLDEAAIEDAVSRACEGCSSLNDLKDFDLAEWLTNNLPRSLETAAPETVRLPSGRVVEVHYERDQDPWIASYLQDFCGAGARVLAVNGTALVAHLLAPNKRPVQITRDLPNFFRTHYPAIRKELMRKYPKHAWPEDPSIPIPPRFR